MRNSLLICFILASVTTSPTAHAQCVPSGMAVIVNQSNPTDSLSMAQLRKLMLGDIHNWPDRKPVTVVRREPTSEVTKCVLSSVVRMTDGEYSRYMMNIEFKGDQSAAMKTVTSAPGVVKSVAGSPGAIGLVEKAAEVTVGAGLKVIRINGKKPGEPGYPL